ncbi:MULTISPECIES: tail fiber assembly protein [Citrobacter freundii complex]|uniref:Tail fiber assembly protein n=2 Tax=Citrobacter TaxID=544 RepID=A0AAI9MNJ5_CITFR|nr:tail fiber assembly protein [Citrobacter freundii]EKV7200314.1 tail fiber assembly protein [Citrobacter freundii]ELF4153290.1 tail fiber assembly protein [Citrobacter freundii]ELJ5789279.1 tail fiber assembly protein [Citrobacter freundii]ELM6923110.1 tail fiber assembly protein [Citrobacter freundii]
MKIFYSPSLNGFLLEATAEEYDGEDLTEVSQDVYNQFIAGSETQIMVAGDNGPVWQDAPVPTQEELTQAAEYERQRRIDVANDFMNRKQWPGKAAIGRLKGDELAQYNLWLDYLDALEAVDISSAPDIEWPTPPGEQAN